VPGFPEEDVLALVDELAPGQLGDQHLVHRRAGGEVEVVQRLHGREPGRLQATVGRLPFPFEQFQLTELQQVGQVVDVVGRRLVGHLYSLASDGREPESLQVVVQQHHGLGFEGIHALAPIRVRVL